MSAALSAPATPSSAHFHLTNSQANPERFFDAFLAKYNSSGNLLWVKTNQARLPDYAANLAIAADSSGVCYVSGNFFTVADFNGISLTNDTESPNLTFIAKYDSSGNPLWARANGSGADSFTASIAITVRDGGAYLARLVSNLSPTISFDSTILHQHHGAESIFLIKYDAAGNLCLGKTASWAAAHRCFTIAPAPLFTTDAAGNVYLAGCLLQSTNANFGGITLNELLFDAGI